MSKAARGGARDPSLLPVSSSAQLGRRALCTAMAAAWMSAALDARAMGRVPIGGELSLRVPWATSRLDPHDLFDPLAAIFGAAVADPVYERDARGQVYPTLADGMPTVEGDRTVVRLRAGLRTAQGRALGGRDLAWSLARARKMGVSGLLAPLSSAAGSDWVRSDPDQPLVVRFRMSDPGKLSLLLSSPLTALLPVGFKPSQPDGTGAFSARCSAGALELSRNRYAARGPSFLERVRVRRAADLADSLRAFESGQDDVGWLGLGFHRSRPKARRFEYGEAGWVVLATGKAAGSYGAPGMAQQLANAVPVERLHLGLGRRAGLGVGASWGGGPAALLYDGGQPHLAEVAEAVAAKLSSPGHELSATAVSRRQLRDARSSHDFALAIDLVRRIDGGSSPLLALASADRPELGIDVALHPPRIPAGRAAHQLTASLRLGVLGSVDVQGGAIAEVVLAAQPLGGGLDLGGSYRGQG